MIRKTGCLKQSFPCFEKRWRGVGAGTGMLKPVYRDPAKPKRPLSAYFRFWRDVRNDPCLSHFKGCDVSKAAPEVSKMWRELPDARRQEYLERARADLDVWQAAYSEYLEKHERNWRKPPGMPRRVVTPYFFFAEEFRQQKPELLKPLGFAGSSQWLGQLWRDMSLSDQKKYYDMHLRDKERYQREISAFKLTGAIEKWKERVGMADVERKMQSLIDRQREEKRQRRELLALRRQKLAEIAKKKQLKKAALAERRKARIIAQARRERDRVLAQVTKQEIAIKKVKLIMAKELAIFQKGEQRRKAKVSVLSKELSQLRAEAMAKIHAVNVLPQLTHLDEASDQEID